MSPHLLTDGIILRKIKRSQHRKQILPLVLFAIFFWLSIMLNRPQVAQILSILALIWYFRIALGFRLHPKIPLPEPDTVYVPSNGKVTALKTSGDLTQITIHKKFSDRVDIRCPKTGALWDSDDLVLNNPRMRISFAGKHLIRLPEAKMRTGEVIAYMPGKATCTIRLPANIPCALKVGSICESGESRITLPGNSMGIIDN